MLRFIKKHGLTKFQRNPHFPVNALALMRCAVAAEAEGLLPAYVEGMFRYMWEEPRKLDDMSVLAQKITDAGLPSQHLMQQAQEQSIKDRLLHYTQTAFDHGVFGIPSFLVGSELFFGKDRLAQVEAEILSSAATS
jgi:2-hydroxychromene-2-carboxylate isomerase